MTTISKGNTYELYVPVDSTYTFTPGSGGSIRFGCSSPVGSDRPIDRRIYAAETISVPGGSTFFAEAIGADATATGAPVSGGGVVDVTDITYDGSSRVAGYTKQGVVHTVTYPDAMTILDSSSSGLVTVSLDGSGRVVNVEVA